MSGEGSPPEGPVAAARQSRPDTVGPLDLFFAFLWVGLSGFGGVLPFARRMLVEQRRWLTPAEFTETLSFSQVLPGPNIVNITVFVGSRFAGVPGALAGFAGLMLMPVVIVLALAAAYDRFGELEPVENALRGVASAAAGLIVATAAKIAWPVLRSARAIVLALLVLLAIVVGKVPLVWLLLLLIPVSLVWTWGARR